MPRLSRLPTSALRFWRHWQAFSFVVLLGLLVSVLLWALPKISRVLEPYLVVLNSLPKIRPSASLWAGRQCPHHRCGGYLCCNFGSIINLYTGFRQVDTDQRKLIRTLGGNKRWELTKVMLPASVPLILSTMKVNIGLCLVGVIIGEFIGARQGLGYLIITAAKPSN